MSLNPAMVPCYPHLSLWRASQLYFTSTTLSLQIHIWELVLFPPCQRTQVPESPLLTGLLCHPSKF